MDAVQRWIEAHRERLVVQMARRRHNCYIEVEDIVIDMLNDVLPVWEDEKDSEIAEAAEAAAEYARQEGTTDTSDMVTLADYMRNRT